MTHRMRILYAPWFFVQTAFEWHHGYDDSWRQCLRLAWTLTCVMVQKDEADE